MKFELDAPYLEIQQQARGFARAIEPIAVEADEMSEIHPGVLAALRESGLSDLMVPAEYGGRSERLDPLAICLVREVLMATSAHADSMFALQGIGSYAITAAGSPEQRAQWLPKVATGETLAALANPSRLNSCPRRMDCCCAEPNPLFPTQAPQHSMLFLPGRSPDTPWCWCPQMQQECR